MVQEFTTLLEVAELERVADRVLIHLQGPEAESRIQQREGSAKDTETLRKICFSTTQPAKAYSQN